MLINKKNPSKIKYALFNSENELDRKLLAYAYKLNFLRVLNTDTLNVVLLLATNIFIATRRYMFACFSNFLF